MNHFPGEDSDKIKPQLSEGIKLSLLPRSFGCAKKSRTQWAFTPFSEQHARPRGAFVRRSRAGPAGTDVGKGETSACLCWGWAGVGLRAGFNSQLSWEGNLFLLELITGMHFSLALLSRRKGRGEALGYLLPLGEFYRREEEGGERSWMAAPVGILVSCLQTDLPNQFRLNAQSLLKYTNHMETFRGL